MDAQNLQICSTIAFIASAVLFALSVFFFVYFRIWGVWGDLTGRTARKSIAKMRLLNNNNMRPDVRDMTGVLSDNAPMAEEVRIEIIDEVMLINTSEVIEE